MTEYKPGKYRLADGEKIIVFVRSIDRRIYAMRENGLQFGWLTPGEISQAEYLGPAVIGDESVEAVLEGFQKLYVKAKVLEEEIGEQKRGRDWLREKLQETEEVRDDYRRKLDKASDEVARLQQVVHEVTRERDEAVRLRVSDVKADLADNARLRKELDDLRWALDIRSVDDDGIEWYRFETVTVAVREGREAVISPDMNGLSWYLRCGVDREIASSTEEAEAWCRGQLVPVEEWRPATVEDVGKECRFRDDGNEHWLDGKLLMYEPSAENPWVVLYAGQVNGWMECEVRT